jgi:MSHA biogenesis protein MshM
MSLYLEHFGLIEPPFRITPGTRFFFNGAKRGEVLTALLYAVQSGAGLIKVVGEVGTGKTMLCRVLMERLPDCVQSIFLPVPTLTRDELLLAIADDLGINSEHMHSTTRLLKLIQTKLLELHGQNKQAVVLIDEAHAMPLATLEELRLISNLETDDAKLLQIVLFGQPELDRSLGEPNMRQLRDRITENFQLSALPEADVQTYLNFRMQQAGYKGASLFTPQLSEALAKAAQGLTRRINILADKTLLAAYVDATHHLQAVHIAQALGELEAPAVSNNVISMPTTNDDANLTTRTLVSPTQSYFSKLSDSAFRAVIALALLGTGLAAGLWLSRFNSTSSLDTTTLAETTSKPSVIEANTQPAIVAMPTSNAGENTMTKITPSISPTSSDTQLHADSVKSTTTISDHSHLLQLMTSGPLSDPTSLEAIKEFEQLAVNHFGRSRVHLALMGEPKRAILLISGFANDAQARATIDTMPEPLKRFSPYPRTGRGIS